MTDELLIVNGRVPGVVALDHDLLSAFPSAIIGTGVRLTVVGGAVVHRSEEPA